MEPVFTPGIKGKKIALDAGHGGSDVGAIGPTGVTEKNITLRIAKELQKQLQAEGAEVIMTRDKDIEVSPKRAKATDIEELQARCDIANRNEADILLYLFPFIWIPLPAVLQVVPQAIIMPRAPRHLRGWLRLFLTAWFLSCPRVIGG